MARPSMRSFWDDRAREDALYFVDSRQNYGEPDLERFFAEGDSALEGFLDSVDVSLRQGQTVVDIGCGVGRLTRAIASRAGRVVAIDVSEEMLVRARELNPDLDHVEWRLGDGDSLTGVPDDSADACVSAVVFQHLPDPQITLNYVREIGRVLRPEGWAAIQFSNDPGIHRRRVRAQVALRGLMRRGPRGQVNRAWLGSSVRVEDLRRTAEEAGLTVEKVIGEGTLFCCTRLRKRAGQPSSSSA
jgi:SAM-dependent methyltransferase